MSKEAVQKNLIMKLSFYISNIFVKEQIYIGLIRRFKILKEVMEVEIFRTNLRKSMKNMSGRKI